MKCFEKPIMAGILILSNLKTRIYITRLQFGRKVIMGLFKVIGKAVPR